MTFFAFSGYVYGAESGLYYLQSRYYNANVGRFINADILVSTGQGFLGNNMFAYCRNNPVCRIDAYGAHDEQILDCTPNLDEDKLDGKASTGSSSTPTVGTVGGTGPSITYLGGQMYPSSGGRHGGALHRAMVDALKSLFVALGFKVSPNERRVNYDDQGNYRYPDIIAENGSATVYIQVGKSTLAGDPIAREARAIADLEKTGYPVLFFPYDD